MDTQEPGKPRRSYRGWWIAAGIVALVAAVIAILWLNGQHRLQRKIEQLHAKGFPITFEEIEQKRKLPDGTPNAADLYQKAFDAFQEPSAQDKSLLPYIGSSKLPEPNEPLSEELKAAIERVLSSNQQSLVLFKQAVDIKDCSFAFSYSTTPIPDLLYLNALSRCGRLLLLEGLLRMERDDSAETVEIISDRNRMASSLTRQPFVIDCLVHHSFCMHTIQLVERLMNRASIDRNSLIELDNSLRECLSFQMLEDAYRNELPLLLVFLDDPSLISRQGVGNSPVRGFSLVVQSNRERAVQGGQ